MRTVVEETGATRQLMVLHPMRWTARRACGLVSIALTAMLILAVGAFALFDSDYGRAFLDRQTETLVSRLLGPGYSARIGRQSIDLGASGQLMVRWSGVEVRRVGVEVPQAEVRSISVGLDPLPLLRGRVEVRYLEVDGVAVDVTGAPESAEIAAAARGLAPLDGNEPATPPVGAQAAKLLLPALFDRMLGQSERQLAALQRIGVDDVVLSDVTITLPVAPGGGPFVARVEHVDLDLEQSREMTLSGMLGVDKASFPVTARIDFDPEAKRLAKGRSTLGPIPLGLLFPPADRDDDKDMRPFGSTSDLTVSVGLDERANDRKRTVEIAAALGPGQLQQGRAHIDVRSADFAVDYVEGEDRITVGDNRALGDDVDVSVAGTLSPVYDKPNDGSFNGFALQLQSRTLRSSVGKADAKAETASFELAGRTDLAAKEIRLDSLDLRAGSGSLTGSGAYRFGAPDARTQLKIVADDLSARSVKAFWPFPLAVGARRWVETNIGEDGRVANGTIVIDASHARFRAATKPKSTFAPGELEIGFALEGLTVNAFGELPHLRDALGTVEVHGSDTIVTVSRAGVDGVSETAIEGGLVTISRVPGTEADPRSDLKIVLNASGKIAALLDVASRKPLNATAALPFEPKQAVGTAKAVADVDLVIGDSVPDGHQLTNWKVSAELNDGGISVPIAGRRVGDLDGSLTVDRSALAGKVKGALDGARGELTFRRSLAETAPDGRRMDIDVKLDGSEAAKLAPALGDVLSGPIAAKVAENADARFRGNIDLSATTLNLPWVGWRKGKGVPASLSFETATRDTATQIDKILFKGEGFSVSGEALADKQGLRSADLGGVALNPGDDVRAKVARVENGYSIAITGSRFDARPLLADIRNNIGAKTAAPPKRGSEQFDVSAAVDTVVGFGGEAIRGFTLNFAGSGSRVAALSIAGAAGRDAPFSVDVSPRGEARSVELHAENAGALADFTGAYGHMDGGKLSLSLVGSYEDGYDGKLVAKNFALVDEPRLSRLVAAPAAPNSQSLAQAVGRDLQPERAGFDHASADIRFGKNGLQLANGIIRGPIFGSSFAGTVYDPANRIDISGSFMPAYGLNRMFGAIPVVGQILGNGREGGLLGITYKLSGAFTAPKLEINPISIIAPGIFRNIFAYQ